MEYRELNIGEIVEVGDEAYNIDYGWTHARFDMVGTVVHTSGCFRRRIKADTVGDPDCPSYIEYTAPGVLVSIDPAVSLKDAAAFIGAIAVMLDEKSKV